MAADHIGMFEEGNLSLKTETSNSYTPHFTRVARNAVSFYKLRRIVVTFLLALWSTFSVEGDVLERLLTDRNRNSLKKLHPCESRCLRLKFSHEVAPVVYTGDCIFPNGTTLELVDVVAGQQVRHVRLPSAQVEIFLLNDDENWTSEELNNHIRMQKRGGKLGRDHNPYLRLEGGVVSVNEIKFKHTAKHKKKLKVVRLGARIVDQPEEIKVREAVTGPFTVKDKRLKSKKRYPPSPTDEVWRLEQICINGAFHKQLTENGIRTVEDFLIELQNNPQRLRQIIGKSMPEKYWQKATMHAETCNLDGRKYSYHHLEMGQKCTVVFNATGQVMWLDSGYGLHHFNMLSESQKAYARKLVKTAFANWKNVQKSDNEISAVGHLSPSPKLEGMSTSHLGNLVTVGECKSEFQSTSGTAKRLERAECSTSYAIAGRHSEPDEMMCFAITSPGHSGLGPWEYLESPNNMTSVISESGDLKEIMRFLCSDAIQFDDFPYANNTQFHELQHEAFTMCKSKYKKSWTKISSILKWLALKRFVKLKKVHMTKKRKLSST